MPISRAAAEIEPVSRMHWSRAALPGPMRAPESKTMLILTRAIATLCHADGRSRHGSLYTSAPINTGAVSAEEDRQQQFPHGRHKRSHCRLTDHLPEWAAAPNHR